MHAGAETLNAGHVVHAGSQQVAFCPTAPMYTGGTGSGSPGAPYGASSVTPQGALMDLLYLLHRVCTHMWAFTAGQDEIESVHTFSRASMRRVCTQL